MGSGQSLSACYRTWKARGRPASRRTSSTVDVLALRHPLQWDGGDGGTMAKKDAASKRLAESRTGPQEIRHRFVLGDKDFRPAVWPKSAPPPCPLNDEDTRRILDEVGGRFVPRGLELEAL